MVRAALDVLVPALPQRLPIEEFSRAVKWTNKMLIDETHSLQTVVHILQIIVRHPDVFYSFRQQLVLQMITNMSRIGNVKKVARERVCMSAFALKGSIACMSVNRALVSKHN